MKNLFILLILMFLTSCKEKPEPGDFNDRILDFAIANAEDKFIELAFEMGPVQGMTADDIKQYIRYIADWRLEQLELEPIYGVKEHPLPWLSPLLNGVEHANFFDARATEYSKGATKGDWEMFY